MKRIDWVDLIFVLCMVIAGIGLLNVLSQPAITPITVIKAQGGDELIFPDYWEPVSCEDVGTSTERCVCKTNFQTSPKPWRYFVCYPEHIHDPSRGE